MKGVPRQRTFYPTGIGILGLRWTGGWASQRPRREHQIEAEIDRYASCLARAATPVDDERERPRGGLEGEGTDEHRATRGTAWNTLG